MKTLAVFVLGLVVGGTLGWWFGPGGYRFLYKTTRPLMLLPEKLPPHDLPTQQQRGCVLPEGTPLLANVRLTRTPDLGWYACAPVIFDDMWHAQDLGVVPWRASQDEVWDRITLRAAALGAEDPTVSEPDPAAGTPADESSKARAPSTDTHRH